MKKKKDFFERQDARHEGNRDSVRHCREESGLEQNHDGQGGRKSDQTQLCQGIGDPKSYLKAEEDIMEKGFKSNIRATLKKYGHAESLQAPKSAGK